jgi:hypothetical protein
MPLPYYKTVLSVIELDPAPLSQMHVDPSDSRLQSDQTRIGLLGLVSAYQEFGDEGCFGRMISAGMSEVISLHCWWKPLSNDCAPISNEHWIYPWAMR